MNILRNVRFLMSAAIFGALIAIGPIGLWPLFILVFVFLEKLRIKKYGFKKIGFARIGIIGCIVVAAYLAPLKYLDHVVNPGDLKFHSGQNGSLLRGDRVSMYLPVGVTKEDLNLGNENIRLRYLISKIEKATSSSHRLGYCGNGVSLLRGASPIGGIQFSPNKFKNENVSVAGTDVASTRRPF